MTRFHSLNFGIEGILSMMRNLYIDRLLRPGNVSKIAGRGAAISTTRKPRNMRCYTYQELGHIKRDCTTRKQERSTTSKWRSLHNSTTHNDAECKAQKGKEGANTPPQDEVTNTLPLGEVHSAHMTTEPTPTEEEDCSYAYVTSYQPHRGKRMPCPDPNLSHTYTHG